MNGRPVMCVAVFRLIFMTQIVIDKILKYAGIAQLARATAFQAVGCGFESRFPLHSFPISFVSLSGKHVICEQSLYSRAVRNEWRGQLRCLVL